MKKSILFCVLILVLGGCGAQDSTAEGGLRITSQVDVGRYAICDDTAATSEAMTGDHLVELMEAGQPVSFFESVSMWQGHAYQVVGEVANTYTVILWVSGIPDSLDFPKGADGGCFVFVTESQIDQTLGNLVPLLSIAEMRYNSVDLFPEIERQRYGG